MAGPWDKYAQSQPAQASGPWQKYAQPSQQAVQSYDPLTVPTQGMSGVNESLANFLSLPNSVELGLRSIGPGIANMFGGNFEMPTESMLPDAGANYRNLSAEIGAIKPPTTDAPSRFARRVGQELGASLIPIAAMPAKVAGTMSALGSGLGAATMQQAFPGNKTAEFAGQLFGGGIPLGIGNQVERMQMRTAAPSLDELRATKDAAYRAADSLGVQYTPQAVNSLIADMEAAAAKANPIRHKSTVSMLDDIRSLRGKSLSLTEVDELRQTIARDLIKSADGGERHFGREMNRALDSFIARADGSFVSAGDPVMANTAINEARAANTRYKKVEDFEGQMTNAQHSASVAGSGGNINNQIRQKARQILDNPKRTMGYSQEELQALEELIAPGLGEDILRGVGKIAPGGNGLMTALGTGAVVHNPLLAVIPAGAQVAKTIADRGTIDRAAIVQALLARGSGTKVPALGPRSTQVLAALLSGQAANQNTPNAALAAALRATGQ